MENNKMKWFNLQLPPQSHFVLDWTAKSVKTNMRNMANISIFLVTNAMSKSLGIAPLLDKFYNTATGTNVETPNLDMNDNIIQALKDGMVYINDIIDELAKARSSEEVDEEINEEVDELVEALKQEESSEGVSE